MWNYSRFRFWLTQTLFSLHWVASPAFELTHDSGLVVGWFWLWPYFSEWLVVCLCQPRKLRKWFPTIFCRHEKKMRNDDLSWAHYYCEGCSCKGLIHSQVQWHSSFSSQSNDHPTCAKGKNDEKGISGRKLHMTHLTSKFCQIFRALALYLILVCKHQALEALCTPRTLFTLMIKRYFSGKYEAFYL